MSARDERRAALYLQRRRHYGLDDKPQVRPRATAFAWSLLIGLAVLGFLLARCEATMRTITVEGAFNQAENIWWWTEAEPYLSLPFAYQLICTFDDEAEDQEPEDPNFGRYLTFDGMISLDFDTPWWPIHVEMEGTEIQVWKARDGLKGISFGNLWFNWSFPIYGLFFPDYFGLYCSFLVPTGYAVTVTDDSLSQVETLQTSTLLRSSSYSFLEGFNDPWDAEYRIHLQENGVAYSVE